MMKTPDLKPCPNCGNIKLGIYRSLLKGRKYEVFCGKCDWYGRQAFTRWGAIKKWNRDCERLSPDEIFGSDKAGIPAYTCENCGYTYWPVAPCPNCGAKVKGDTEMRTYVELDKKDIASILAKHFNVDESSVTLSAREVWEGQGPTERKVYAPSAKVILKENVRNENA